MPDLPAKTPVSRSKRLQIAGGRKTAQELLEWLDERIEELGCEVPPTVD